MQQKSDEYVQDLIEALNVLISQENDDTKLSHVLENQIWVVEAIRHKCSEPSIHLLATKLRNLIAAGASGKEIRTSAQSLFSTWDQSHQEYMDRSSTTLRLAWWTAFSAVVSTLFSILIGTQGLLPLMQSKDQVAKASEEALKLIQHDPIEFGTYLVQVIIIALLVGFNFTQFGSPSAQPEKVETLSTAARRTLKKFFWGWSAIWFTWLALYAWFLTTQILASIEIPITSGVAWAIADILNLSNSIAFFYCYLILDIPHLENKPKDQTRNQHFNRKLMSLGGTCLILAILSAIDRLDIAPMRGTPSLLISFVVAVAMAYFFGRLDSHYLGIKRWMLAPLYTYVAIQVTWPGFESSPDSYYQIIFFVFALVLKIYLYVVVTYWLQNAYISRYIERACEEYTKNKLGREVVKESRSQKKSKSAPKTYSGNKVASDSKKP